eukprot:Lithocolla_globosa_v1_NODE_1733_length_2372_cov_39.757223.p1 type:complete len:756 gc:universal NODE_1733_length_2372_cov_39.757223:2331-64(-)
MVQELEVLLPDGQKVPIPYEPTSICKDLTDHIISNSGMPEEEKNKHKLAEIRVAKDGISQEAILNPYTNVATLAEVWANDTEYKTTIACIRFDTGVRINFNMYFRMTAGVGLTQTTLYLSAITTVEDVVQEILGMLKKPLDETRFYLFGNQGEGKPLRTLFKNELVMSLAQAWENSSQTFFQFQVVPTEVDNKHMGVDKAGWLEVGGLIWKRRWCALRSSSLFCYRDQRDNEVVGEVNDIETAVAVRETTKKKIALGQKYKFGFEIEVGGKVHLFAAEDEVAMNAWIASLKSAKKESAVANVAQTGPKRTFHKVGTLAAEKAGGVSGLDEKLSTEELLVEYLDRVRNQGSKLLMADSGDIINQTKALIDVERKLVLKIDELSKGDAFKQERLREGMTDVKVYLKTIIPAAKQVAVDPTPYSEKDLSPARKALKQEIDNLYNLSEILVITYSTDLVPEEVVEAPQAKIELKATGNEKLDSAVSNLNAFGMTPELAAMMSEAQTMNEDEVEQLVSNAEKAAVDDVTAGGAELDDMLGGLMDQMGSLDFEKPAVEPKKARSKTNAFVMALNPEEESAMCNQCYGMITGKIARGFGLTWHPECFYCTQCARELGDLPASEIFQGPGGPYCKTDFLKICAPCVTCTKPVLPDEAHVALNRVFHTSCFKCANCTNDILSVLTGAVFDVQGMAYCEKCFHSHMGTLCVECEKPITDNFLTILGKKRHKECFICNICKSTLTKETTKAREARLLCSRCFNQFA